MKKNLLTCMIFLLVVAVQAQQKNYYVSALTGSNAYSGLTTSQPKATLQAAADLTNPGDTVFVMNGNYQVTGTPGINVLNIGRAGNATARIIYTAYPGHTPVLRASADNYAVINIRAGVSYVTINGLEIIGYGANLSLAADTTPAKTQLACPVVGSPATAQTPLQKYNGHGITGDSRSQTIGSHHIVITNNVVHDCAAAGIGFLKCDYITVENNTLYNNSWYTIYGTSGISFNNFYNYDANTTTYRNIVRNNTSYGNRMYVPFYNDCKVTDGNGIIIDIPQTDYNGKTLVANNICFNNGGSGIHSFRTNHVDIFNNISYFNSASSEIDNGGIYAREADDVKIYNNIIVARQGKKVNGNFSSTNLVYDYNIYFGGSSVDFVGSHSLIRDPKFVNPSTDAAVADFRLQMGSVAINNGSNLYTTETDKDGNARPTAGMADIGPYESTGTGNLTNCTVAAQSQDIGRPGGIGEPGATFYGPFDSKTGTANQKGRHAIMYPQGLMSAVPSNANLTSIKFRRALQSGSTQTVPDNSIVKIYLRNEAVDNFGAAAFDWNTILPTASNPAVLVYGGEASQLTGNAGGWLTVPFQVPFTYTGQHLGVYIEYLQKGSITGGTDINWIYDNATQPLYNRGTYPTQAYGTKYITSTGTLPDNLTSSNERRPVFAVGYCSSLVVLPVRFQEFSAQRSGSSILLRWLISNETASAGFEVQRSADSRNFIPLFFVPSKSTNSSSNNYDFTDIKPLNGISYYRLLQKDNDGKLSYSSVVKMDVSGRQLNTIRIYPNPVPGKLNASISNNADAIATVRIHDKNGKMLLQSKRHVPAGYSNMEMDVNALPASVYWLVVELPSGQKVVSKFIKATHR